MIRGKTWRIACGTVDLCLALFSNDTQVFNMRLWGGVVERMLLSIFAQWAPPCGIARNPIPCIFRYDTAVLAVILTEHTCLFDYQAFHRICDKKGWLPAKGCAFVLATREKTSICSRRSLAKSMILRLVPAPLKLKQIAMSSKITVALAWGTQARQEYNSHVHWLLICIRDIL